MRTIEKLETELRKVSDRWSSIVVIYFLCGLAVIAGGVARLIVLAQ